MEWIDVGEAVKLSGKSVATVRRAIKRLSPDLIKKEKEKHLYKREIILRELGIDISVDTVVDTFMPKTLLEHDSAIDTRLIDTMQAQIQSQQRTIDQLLERQREQNVIINNYQQRMLTVREAPEAPQGKTAKEVRRENMILLIGLAVVIIMVGTVIYISWHPFGS